MIARLMRWCVPDRALRRAWHGRRWPADLLPIPSCGLYGPAMVRLRREHRINA